MSHAGVHLSFIPPPWVRALNADARANGGVAIPWIAFGVVHEPCSTDGVK